MPKFIDITGKKIGLLTIISRAKTRKNRTYWNIICECGITKEMQQFSIVRNVKNGIKSCGCQRRKTNSVRLTKHGMKNTLEFFLFHGAKRRAKMKGLDFDIKIFDIKIPEICPLLGIPLIKMGRKITDNSPSIDRINPKKGYIKSNIWVISYKANSVKNNCSLSELELLVINLRKYASW